MGNDREQYSTSVKRKEDENAMKFIPYEKLSKKKKREADLSRRGGWGGLSPVTRRAPDRKKYDRKKLRLPDDGETQLFPVSRRAARLQNKVL